MNIIEKIEILSRNTFALDRDLFSIRDARDYTLESV